MSRPLALDDLGDQTLVDLAASLAAELREAERRCDLLGKLIQDGARRLRKPGAKLSLNAACAIFGFAMAPWTLGLSLGVSAVGAAVTVWDGIDFARDAARIISRRTQLRELRDQVKELNAQLNEVETILMHRDLQRQSRPS